MRRLILHVLLSLQVYTYCVQDEGNPNSKVAVLVPDSTTFTGVHYLSDTSCVNKTVEWAGSISVTIHTTMRTPVPGILVSHGRHALV